jgi:hypothetical protein
MAVSVTRRRVCAVALESVRGTFQSGMSAANDALPTIREATISRLEPIRVERETLRLSLTGMPDIYPGVATADVTVLAEIGGVPPNIQSTASYASPVWSDLLRAAGFTEVSAQGSPASFTGETAGAAVTRNPRIYHGFTNFTGGTGAGVRHGETIQVDYATSGDIGPANTFVVGDTYGDDDMICIDEPAGSVAGSGAITLRPQTSGKTSAGTVTRDTSIVVAFKLLSDVNLQETISLELYNDGKRLRLKGALANMDLLLDHGDVLKARFTVRGIVHAYEDQAIPTNANESHYLPPTFLGKDVRMSTIDGAKRYGKDGASVVGAFNRISIQTGNEIILRENSLDPAGVSRALIVDRSPTGSFNPDEVQSTDYDFYSQFRQGLANRLRAFIGNDINDANPAGDGNTIDVIAPGCVFTGLADVDRDQVNVWDASFDLTGGDYDTTAAGELPGNDNELTLIYR